MQLCAPYHRLIGHIFFSMRVFLVLAIGLLGCIGKSVGQSSKQIRAVRTKITPKIDGLLTDEAWKNAPEMSGFIEQRPVPGRIEKQEQQTVVKILYDNVAIYVYARMNENNPDSIAREIAPRDQVGNADFIGVIFDTYRDKLNGNGFYVTSAGSQYDAKYSNTGNEDSNWDAVWESGVKIDNEGWSVEMKIPYSALRFSNKSIQTWGINFMRKRQKAQQQLFWSHIDPKINGFINQAGELTHIEDIKAPLRLSFSPYISSYVNHYPVNLPYIKNTTNSLNGGMDVKYGINQSFTLDMTLIPDFGQVQSDNLQLNLTPFEIKYDEQRQFFTEGTELFNKGELFYSRRIGSFPTYKRDFSGQLAANEEIIKNPDESKLINATKISGRTANGLGIGVFNAVTKRVFATIKNTVTGEIRTIENQPLTNYNILVFDQSLKNNSSLSFLNTNVLRQGSAYDANVSALLFTLNDKKNRYFISGSGKMSYLKESGTEDDRTGFFYNVSVGKKSGNFRWKYKQELSDKDFDPSDMGFFTNNNYLDHYTSASYSIYKPSTWYNVLESWLDVKYSQRLKPMVYQSFGIYPGIWTEFKNFWSVELVADWQKWGNDFYESRTAGKVYHYPENYGFNISLNTNSAKRYSGGAYFSYRKNNLFDGWGYGTGFHQNFRVTNKLSLGTELEVEPRFNFAGWIDKVGDDIIFSRYDRRTIEGIINVKYTFNNRMGITLRGRHYWSDRNNLNFYKLTERGYLENYAGYTKNKNRSYNVFNVDMVYTWQFAPGSEFSIAWKDSSSENDSDIRKNYGRNFDHIINSPQNNNLSLKVLYYLDYLQLRKKR